ncbi:MAG: hypothetical protein ACPGDB_02625 [Fusobacterium sp.]
MKFKHHPTHSSIKVREDGKVVKQNNIELTIAEVFPKPNNPLMIVYIGKTQFSLSKLVLETYKGLAPSDNRYYAIHKDNNYKNTHPDNLEWSSSNITEEKLLKSSIKRSKLTEEEVLYCYKSYKKGATLKTLGEEFGVSDMSIHRAIKRAKKLLNS